MATKRLKCRTHGGYFSVEARRGRPPVNCTEENECDAQKIPTTKRGTAAQPSLDRRMVTHASNPKTATSDATPALTTASGTPDRAAWVNARAATAAEINRIFRELVVLGWDAKRAWVDKSTAEIIAIRGIEMLYVTVTNGVASTQYSLWDFEKPFTNHKPVSKLPFDPDEIGDRELARLLVGTKVTWYNRLSGKEETGYCGSDRIVVEHSYNPKGDELPGERIVKFVDADARNFRAFRLDQLLKVGK